MTARKLAQTPIDAPGRRRLPILLRHAWYGLNQAFRRRIAGLDLTPDQFTTLRTLLEGDPLGMTQRELTQTIWSDPNTVAALLNRMEQAGLIERLQHEKDRRARRIRILPEGRRRFDAARNVAQRLQIELFDRLPPGFAEPFLEELERVAGVCRTLAAESPRPQARRTKPAPKPRA
jgi:DNA-binding MarR family transcriptional regulator